MDGTSPRVMDNFKRFKMYYVGIISVSTFAMIATEPGSLFAGIAGIVFPLTYSPQDPVWQCCAVMYLMAAACLTNAFIFVTWGVLVGAAISLIHSVFHTRIVVGPEP